MDGDMIGLRNVLGLIRRRVWIIVLTVVLAIALAGVALLALTPIYSASALVLVDPSKKNLLDPDQQTVSGGSDTSRVDSEVALVVSETTLADVVQKLDLVNDPEFGVKLSLRDKLMAFLRIGEPELPTGEQALWAVLDKLDGAVSAQRRDTTFLIEVEARSTRPEMAAALANAVARAYIEEQLKAKVDATLAGRDIIQARIKEATAAVGQSEAAFDDFIDANLTRISAETGRADLVALKAEIDRAAAARSSNEANVDAAEKSLASRDWKAISQALESDVIKALEQERETLQTTLNNEAAGSGDAIRLRDQLRALESRLETNANDVITSLKNALADARAKANTQRAELRTAVLDTDLPPDVLTSIYELQQSAEIARAQYQALLTRQKDLENQAFLQLADSRQVSEATPPRTAAFPNARLMLTLAVLVGLAAGVGLAFLVETFFGGFTSEEQVQNVLRLPLAGAVPKQKASKWSNSKESGSVADSLITAPLSSYSEAIRRVRIGLDQAVAERARRPLGETGDGVVIMVTSAVPNEGKTTLALSLARAYALSGRSTLLIDCDLRRPGIHRQLGLEPSDGLLDYLNNRRQAADVRSFVVIDADSDAQIVLGSHGSQSATDQLLAGKTFVGLIVAAKKNFEVVILDVPPVGPVVDGLYVSSVADVIAYVMKWSDTPQQEVKGALRGLLRAKPKDVPVLGVLNQQDNKRGRYGGRYAGYYLEA